MKYFMSDLRGADKAYFEMKDRICLKNNDDLYLLGDVLDGNSKNPGGCFAILDDVMTHENIHMILGDHELFHVMYRLSEGDEEAEGMWEQEIIDSGGEALHRYLLENTTRKESDKYIKFLVEQDMTAILSIGDNLFYLVHGSPQICTDDIPVWQYKVVTTPLDLNKSYSAAIRSDIQAKMIPAPKLKEAIIIAGHRNTKSLFEDGAELFRESESVENRLQRVVYRDRKMMIDCGCSGDFFESNLKVEERFEPNLSCVGIDAAGFFVERIRRKG